MFRHALVAALVVAVSLASAGASFADQGRRRAPDPPRPSQPSVVLRGEVFIGGYFYDPIFGPYPWWPRTTYPFLYYPRFDQRAFLRLRVTPDIAAVYVDGFYAGVVDDFDGVFDGLPLPPGGHNLVLYLEGFRTARHNIYVPPGASFSLRDTLEPLPAGTRSAPPVPVPPVPTPPAGTYRLPGTAPPALANAPETTPLPNARFGTLDLRVQPATATVMIDGEVWVSSDGGRFVIELPIGVHHLEVSEPGHRGYVREITVRDGETTTFNVSLAR